MWNSLKTGFIVNFALTSISYVKEMFYDINFGAYSLFESITTIGMVAYMDTINKPDIKENNESTLNKNDNTTIRSLLQIAGITSIKCVTHYILINYVIGDTSIGIQSDSILDVVSNVVGNGVSIIIKSFVFEMAFDCVHYGVHRSFHEFPTLYKNVHKYHHEYSNPTAWTAFHIHPVDLILSYSIPLFIATMIVSPSKNELMLITTYLTHQEIGGHLGKKMYPTSCFAQCIWLPRFMNIELYTEDHDLHHKKINYNFGKRFALCDKIFGTYKSGTTLQKDIFLEKSLQKINEQEIAK